MFPALLCSRGLLQDGRTRGYKRKSYACSHSAEEIARLKLEFSGSAVDTVFVLGLPLAFLSVLVDPVSAYIYVLYNTHT